MDKRELSELFRIRLADLVRRSGLNASAFAASVKLDRSALSQLLSGTVTRLPRTETLVAIAAAHNVSLDWLLGLSQTEGLTGELRAALEIEEAVDDADETLLARWHGEAAGTKIRYVPAAIPDLLRSEALIAFEAQITQRDASQQRGETQSRLAYNRRPETDMEACMPRQTLELLAAGQGIWTGMSAPARKEQLRHMAALVDDLYPTFRLYLFDGRTRFSIPYTVFGTTRAALYVGGLYMLLNATEPVRTLTRHFDGLVRSATVNAHETAAWVEGLV